MDSGVVVPCNAALTEREDINEECAGLGDLGGLLCRLFGYLDQRVVVLLRLVPVRYHEYGRSCHPVESLSEYVMLGRSQIDGENVVGGLRP